MSSGKADSTIPASIKARLGQRVRELRRERGYSQEQFAARCGLDRTYIASVEHGRRNVTIATVERIASGLGISVAELFDTPEFRLPGHKS